MRFNDNMRMHVESLYTWDVAGRITGSNQFTGGDIPRFHLARSRQGNLTAFSSRLQESVVKELQALTDAESPPGQIDMPPALAGNALKILGRDGAIRSVWQGPVYRFTRLAAPTNPQIVDIDATNADVLARYMDDWLVDVPHRSPFVALVVDGHAVAVCASARMTDTAHQAGVETVPAFRQRGYAAQVVSAWAHRTNELGAEPLYSTSWDNLGSQSVARSLGLLMIGTDFHVR